tara:strand:+ start:2838 stop:9035 length:6198 start_codon:yes stop_codon:yes gene_type:complete
MAIYTFTSGIESESVGQYSNFILSSLATRTIGSFTVRTARGLFGFISSEESVSYCYEPSVIDRYIELDYGLITVNNTTSINNGNITNRNATQVDYGRIIYVTNVESFGFVKVVSEASWKATQAYQGSGNIGLFGKEQSPAFYNYITDGKVRCSGNADPAFSPATESRGGLSLHGNSPIGITAITTGGGQIFSGGLKSESRTKVYPLGEEILDLVITPDDLANYNRNIVNVSITNGGNGTSSNGGFNIGRHYRFSGGNSGVDRYVWFQVDVSNYESIDFEVIRGNSSNGGEIPDSNEHLYFQYWTGSTWSTIGSVLASDSSFDKLKTYSITPSQTVRNTNGGYVYIRAAQLNHSGGGVDNWGLRNVSLRVSADTRKTLFDIIGDAYVLRQHAYDTEGNLFNFSSATERSVFSYQGSGTLFGFNNLEEARVYDYDCHDANAIDYFEKVDHGEIDVCTTTQTITGPVTGTATGCIVSVTGTASIAPGQTFKTARGVNAPTHFIDYRYVRETPDVRLDFGHILTTSNIMPCGLFTFNKEIGSDNKFTPNWNGVGGIKLRGGARVPLDVGVFGTGFFKKLGGAAETVAVAEESKDLFRVNGSADIGITAIVLSEGGTLFGIGGAAESFTSNPEERQILFSFTGTLTERYSQDHVGEGVLFTLQTAVEKSVFSYSGSGDLFGFNNLEEARVYDYNCSSIVEYRYLDYGLIVDRNNLAITQIGTTTISTPTTGPTGAIQVATGATVTIAPGASYTVPNQLSTPQYFEDYGTVTKRAAPLHDYGWILGTIADGQPGCKYGNIEIEGVADIQYVPSWVGSGFIKVDGVAYVPLDANVRGSGNIKKLGGAAETVAVAETTTDLFKISGTPTVGITAVTINDGSLFGIGGAAESATFNPPEETPLLKFTGSAEPPLLVYSEFSSGTLFSFAGQQERNTFSWNASGTIKLRARKPETYELSELAAFTLEDYQLCSPYINLGDTSFYSSHTQLGCTQLKWLNLEESHEKHTEVYSLGLCFDQPELDYGLIVDRNAVACVTINGGTVSTNTTATTGCTKIAVGTVLQIAPGVTYEVPPQLSIPTDRENYGDILKDLTGARIDYGHILEGTGINCPFGSLGTIGNNAEHRFLRNTVGTNAIGGLIKIFGETDVFFTPPYITEGGFKVEGAATTLFSLLHPSEGGTIAAFSGAAETVRWSPDEEQLLFTTKGAARTLFSLLHPGSGVIRVTPGVDQARAARPPAGGFINIDGAAGESFIANPPEEQILFRFTGVLGESFTPATHIGEGVLFNFSGSSELLTFAEKPEVNIRISGTATAILVPNHVGSGSLFALSGAAESFTANPEERQLLFSFTGTLAESFTPATEIGSGLAKLSGTTSPEILAFTEQPFGTISVLGDSRDRFTPQHIGSGSLFALNGAAEAVGFNPPEEAPIFKFTGELTEAFIANPPEEGTEIKLFGSTAPEILTFAEQPFGTISVFGDADTPRTRPFIGSGTLRKFSGAAESLTVNPDEKQMLFSFTGASINRHTESYFGVDTPIRIRRGSLSDFQTYDFQPNWQASGTVRVFGEAITVYSPVYFGSGTLRKFSGAAESLTVNPDERQMLFSFTGESTERTSASHVGEGNLFAFSGGAERVAYAPTLLADLRINGEVGIRYVPNNVGFGTIFNIGGSAESVTFNPDERQLLFSFTGEVVESFGVAETKKIEVDIIGDGSFIRTFAYEGSGTVSISGDSSNKLLINNVGFGNIFNIGGSAEAVTFNPEERQMLFSFTGERLAEKRTSREVSRGGVITITGTAGDPSLAFAEQPTVLTKISGKVFFTTHRSIVGTGSLFAFSGGAEAVGAVPPTDQALFKVVGDSENKRSAVYVGSGSLRKLSGAAESVSFNPDERQMLFSFTGERISEKRTSREISQGGTLKVSGESSVLLTLAHQGEGTIPVTGDTKFTRARDFVGFGTFRKLSGAAESLTFNPTERDMLFSFTGERIAERTTFRELGTAGKFTFTGTSGDPLLTFAEQPFVNIDVTGDSVDIRSRAYQSTGTLFAINNVDESFIRTGYQGSGSLKLSGIALVQVQLFQPSRVYVWII